MFVMCDRWIVGKFEDFVTSLSEVGFVCARDRVQTRIQDYLQVGIWYKREYKKE